MNYLLFYFYIFNYFRDSKEIAPTFNIKMLQSGSVCTLKVNKVTKAMSGVYKCVASNSSGSKASEATVTIEGWLKYMLLKNLVYIKIYFNFIVVYL